MITALAEGVSRGVESVGDRISESLFEPVVRLGVTGLARSGKTVFITSLVANMLDRARMINLNAAAEGRILAAYLQPQPDVTVPRFDFEAHRDALIGPEPHWPQSTRSISELRLSLRVKPNGLLAGIQRPRTVHLDIVDYPGEWLLDLGLMNKNFDTWSQEVLGRLSGRGEAREFRAELEQTDALAELDEPVAQALARAFTAYLHTARDAGYSDCTPGRFLLPGDLAGSPALTFAPMRPAERPGRKSLYREMERRFEAYKSHVVRPFFKDHFARIDRQVVLVDALGAIHNGPSAVDDLRLAMQDVLSAFRPGGNSFLRSIFGGRRVEKILFAATKADHLHHQQHPRLTGFMQALMRDVQERAQFAGAETHALSLASLRTTTEDMLRHADQDLPCVRGRLLNTGRHAAFYPGELPEDPTRLLTPARQGAERWLDADYEVMSFAPAPLTLRRSEGPPHIRLDRAAQFLFGDKL